MATHYDYHVIFSDFEVKIPCTVKYTARQIANAIFKQKAYKKITTGSAEIKRKVLTSLLFSLMFSGLRDVKSLQNKQTTAFTILNCLEYEFLKGFLVQERQQSF